SALTPSRPSRSVLPAAIPAGQASLMAALGWPPAGTAGARRVARRRRAAAAARDVGPHALADLGAVDIALHTAKTALDAAAAEIDADPEDRLAGGRLLAP